jgi:hypothetical protein
VGVSPRTVQRWLSRGAGPATSQTLTIARALYPLDAALAAQFAEAGGQTLESLGLAAPRLPSAAIVSVPLRHVVDAVVYAAADAGELPTRAARRAVSAALRCMSDAGVAVETVLGVLAEGEPGTGTTKRARGAGRPAAQPRG